MFDWINWHLKVVPHLFYIVTMSLLPQYPCPKLLNAYVMINFMLLSLQDSNVTKNAIYSTSIAEQGGSNTHATVKMRTLQQWKDIPLPDNQLAPGQKLQLSMLVQAPSWSGHHMVDMLYYYQPLQVTSKLE